MNSHIIWSPTQKNVYSAGNSPNYEATLAEAKRLAEEHPNVPFEVYTCVASVQSKVEITTTFPVAPLLKRLRPSTDRCDTEPAPAQIPIGWKKVKEGIIQKNDLILWLDDLKCESASEFIGSKYDCCEETAIYRYPDRFPVFEEEINPIKAKPNSRTKGKK